MMDMNTPELAPDQLRALRNKHGYPDAVVTRVFDLVARDHTNAVSAVDQVLTRARKRGVEPLAVVKEFAGPGKDVGA